MHALLAMSPALRTTIVFLFVWGVAFPAFVTGLIVYAVVQARGERRDNERARVRREGG